MAAEPEIAIRRAPRRGERLWDESQLIDAKISTHHDRRVVSGTWHVANEYKAGEYYDVSADPVVGVEVDLGSDLRTLAYRPRRGAMPLLRDIAAIALDEELPARGQAEQIVLSDGWLLRSPANGDDVAELLRGAAALESRGLGTPTGGDPEPLGIGDDPLRVPTDSVAVREPRRSEVYVVEAGTPAPPGGRVLRRRVRHRHGEEVSARVLVEIPADLVHRADSAQWIDLLSRPLQPLLDDAQVAALVAAQQLGGASCPLAAVRGVQNYKHDRRVLVVGVDDPLGERDGEVLRAAEAMRRDLGPLADAADAVVSSGLREAERLKLLPRHLRGNRGRSKWRTHSHDGVSWVQADHRTHGAGTLWWSTRARRGQPGDLHVHVHRGAVRVRTEGPDELALLPRLHEWAERLSPSDWYVTADVVLFRIGNINAGDVARHGAEVLRQLRAQP
ncbi:MAG: hypothetical protein AAGA42_16125 [Actinomycetota bacterium]